MQNQQHQQQQLLYNNIIKNNNNNNDRHLGFCCDLHLIYVMIFKFICLAFGSGKCLFIAMCSEHVMNTCWHICIPISSSVGALPVCVCVCALIFPPILVAFIEHSLFLVTSYTLHPRFVQLHSHLQICHAYGAAVRCRSNFSSFSYLYVMQTAQI